MPSPLSSPQGQRAAVIEMLRRAAGHHQRGELGQAEVLYREVLAREPANFDALHLYGVLLYQRGNPVEALKSIAQALKVNARAPAAYSNHGIVLGVLSRHEEALESHERAIALKPDYAEAHNNRGNALRALKRHAEALESYAQALALRPDYAEAHNNRGNALASLGRMDEALDAYQRALAARPGYADALVNRGKCLLALKRADEALQSLEEALRHQPRHPVALRHAGDLYGERNRLLEALAAYDKALAVAPAEAETHAARGFVLRQLNRHDEALACYDRALALKGDYVEAVIARGNVFYEQRRYVEALAAYEHACHMRPDFAQAHGNRGNTLRALGRHQKALASFERALALDPHSAETFNNRGNTYLELNRVADALADYERALSFKPDFAFAHVNRAAALHYLGRLEEARAGFERALTLAPQLPDAHWNKALLDLECGDFARGLPGYEWRWRRDSELKPRDFREPQWQGEDIAGKTILLHAEQGFGDTIQMARYLPMVLAKSARVVLEVPDSLRPLLGDYAADIGMIPRGADLPPFDVHCPLMSLPLAFGTRLETIPAQVPYLRVPADRHDRWRARLPRDGKLRVGLVWSGKPSHKNDHNRSIPLARLAPALGVAGLRFVSLQQEYRDSDLPALSALPIERLDEALLDFGETAAAVERLDLVISVDSAVAHLTGALGKPLWLLVSHIQDWRWLRDREDSPWYPSARLFRQPAIGDWDSVVARLRDELTRFAGAAS
ncbi:MAG: tetratricopeptide repeat protein [Pseudolabrys sp.]